ncbi:L,D-transpeptidase family protein [Octadecabacter sp.]|nr:L,D-transpeptidase family protein [Octadecabacter sp.]MDC1230570.1 L,D-transpeptidase family protein [Octadecabacter sp.]MDC1396672.1 L,D-transpeptidase family protein [Octadecabacter sp.]MDC1500734.1 L,D-transpeptidase family protein [Octadecabacter sp.]
MMNRRTFTSVAALFALTACSNKFRVYTGPPVTSVVVQKGRRQMFLMNGNQVLESYDFELGFVPVGHKQVEGDGKTPEGAYFIDRKNPNSSFYLSIGISYPNEADRAKARAMGESPGGDIFIHGTPKRFRRDPDWTGGCIAVKDREMEDIYAMVNVGTPIFLYA